MSSDCNRCRYAHMRRMPAAEYTRIHGHAPEHRDDRIERKCSFEAPDGMRFVEMRACDDKNPNGECPDFEYGQPVDRLAAPRTLPTSAEKEAQDVD